MSNEQETDNQVSEVDTGGNGKRKRILLVIGSLFLLAALAWLLLYVFIFSLRERTEDAYVQGNQVVLGAQVTGTVIEVLADDTDRVESGQPLVRLDAADAEVGLASAHAALATAVRQVRQMTASAAQFDAAVDARTVALRMARADLARRKPLLAEQAVSAETIAHLSDKVKSSESELILAQRQASAAHAAVDGTDIANNPSVLEARAAFRKAWLADHRTTIVAPVDGYVAKRGVQVGQQIKPGQPLMQIIALQDLWIEANYKESDLRHVRIGQPVSVSTALYGSDVIYHGNVTGLGAGTGSAFALLPPQNASGNWIKVVQRVPVRISLEPTELARHPLRIGLSTEVTIDTHNRNGKVLAQSVQRSPAAQTSAYSNNFAQAEQAAEAIIQANLGSSDAN